MSRLPRLALSIPPEGPEPCTASLAMMAGLARRRWRVQHFRSRACPYGTQAVEQVTGRPGRHLDDWLMAPEVCRNLFVRGLCHSDLALVEGTLEPPVPEADRAQYDLPGCLEGIAAALDLPRIAVVECPRLDGMHMQAPSGEIDAVLLDGLIDAADFVTLRRAVRLILNKPVIGAVEALPDVRAQLRAAPRELCVSEELFDRLGSSFLKFADLEAIHALARSRPFPFPHDPPCRRSRGRFRVAYAQDEAFGGYFPDTLETLEALGAELCEFSPLGDERLPEAVDLVMIGCGYPDRYADALGENVSMVAALRAHVCAGRRIYSEGGGTAYLGRYMLIEDRAIPGAGILPLDATLCAHPSPPRPVSRVLLRDSWLGSKGTTVRGYCSGRWRMRPADERPDCPGRSGPLTRAGDIYFHHHAVGGLIHLHLSSLPEVVTGFASPHRPSLSLP